MKNKTGTIMIIFGTMLILSALFLCWYNIKENRRAYEDSQKVLVELKQLIPVVEEKDEKEEIIAEIPAVNPADDLFAPYEEKKEETPVIPEPIELDGTYYCGYITLPTLGLELPVVDGWSYAALRNAPCRYSGSAAENDIIIAGTMEAYNIHYAGVLRVFSDGVVSQSGGSLRIERATSTYYIFSPGTNYELTPHVFLEKDNKKKLRDLILCPQSSHIYAMYPL